MNQKYLIGIHPEHNKNKLYFSEFGEDGKAIFGAETEAKIYDETGPGLPIHKDIRKIQRQIPKASVFIKAK